MSKPDNPLTLRMKATIGSETPEPTSNEIVVYHWGRLLGVLTVLLLLAVAFIWIFWPVTKLESVDANPVAEQQTTTADNSKQKQPAGDQPQTDYAGDPPQADSRVATDESAGAGNAEGDGQAPVTGNDKPATSRPEQAPQGEEHESTTTAGNKTGEASGTRQNNEVSETATTASPAESEPSPQRVAESNHALAEVSIQSPHLHRATLTQNLQEKEPVGNLPGVVAMGEEGIIRVFFFNHLLDLKGRTLFHNWYRDGERVARVTIRPYSDSMRASSAKYINRDMLGQWRVEAVTAEGSVLGSGRFQVLEAGD